MRKVLILGAHPAEQSISMEVCRVSILKELSSCSEFEFTFWPSEEKVIFSNANKLQKFILKYFWYPLFVFFKRDYDVVHLLDHSSAHLLNFVRKGKLKMATVHDLIPLEYSEGLSEKQLARYRANIENLNQADVLFSVSDYTKEKITEFLKISSEKIIHNPNGVDRQFIEFSNKELQSKEGKCLNIISVGNLDSRKNVSILFPAIDAILKSSNLNVKLLRVGEPLNEELLSSMERLSGRFEFEECGYVDNKEKLKRYTEADVLFFPSTHEGFGLPILEAYSTYTKVVCSNSSCLPEVAGEYAYYFDPNSVEQAAEALMKASSDTNYGFEDAKRYASSFTWKKHTEKLKELYRKKKWN